ncbi:hypothetical protein EBZ80_19645 [bacterium]|nr:hypothetical protein [bacterium]
MKRETDDKKMKQRKDHNEQILKRMAAGEPLWAFDSKASWFPPRPVIQKDPKAIGQLYGAGVRGGVKGTEPQLESAGVRTESPKLKELNQFRSASDDVASDSAPET